MAKVSRVRVPVDGDVDAVDVEDTPEDASPSESASPARTVTRKGPVSSGWGAPAEDRPEVVKAPILKLKDNGKRIVKLLDEMPPVKYKRHYLNSTKRYYTCTQNECPLCIEGVRSSWTFAMNIVDMADDPGEVKTWTFGTEVATQLQTFAEDLPLDGLNRYFHVYHEKLPNRDAPATRVLPLKARDLQEDFGIEPLNESEIEALLDERFGGEVVYLNTNSHLEEIAAGVLKSDLPQKRTN